MELAIAADCSAVATTLGGLGAVARRYAHKIPFIVKLNHNELLTYPSPGRPGACSARCSRPSTSARRESGRPSTSGRRSRPARSTRSVEAFAEAHRHGLFTVLWCYLRNPAFKTAEADYHLAADLTGQANHLGVTIEADIIKQKQPENNGGYTALEFGRTDPLVYTTLTTDHPVDLTRWQVVNCYMGRIGLINSGGESKGSGDLAQAVRTAVINKRAGGTGLIVGRKAFQRPIDEGVELIHAVQDVFLDGSVTVA